MKIRPEQMSALGADRLEMLVDHAGHMLLELYPEVAYRKTPDEQRGLVKKLIGEAVEWGLASEEGALRYIQYRMEFGEGMVNLPKWAWVREILGDKKLTEADKIARIEHLAYGAPKPDNWTPT
ncbi:MAG: hypothetical protein IPK82_28485 [Polyangiaceae bacterium]|nr:hypothetical protein [Polyangiaceae bacterium]